MSASLVASATTGIASFPDETMSFATASTADFVRPATITFRPSAAKRLHNWAPSPRSGPTPITIAVFMVLPLQLTLEPASPSRWRLSIARRRDQLFRLAYIMFVILLQGGARPTRRRRAPD